MGLKVSFLILWKGRSCFQADSLASMSVLARFCGSSCVGAAVSEFVGSSARSRGKAC
jgi:hypothetical protein